jgi:hypothetical protein
MVQCVALFSSVRPMQQDYGTIALYVKLDYLSLDTTEIF